MAKWKMAGQLAVAMREAERQAERKRMLEERRLESIKSRKIFRKIERNRHAEELRANRAFGQHERLFKVLNNENESQTLNSYVASSDDYNKQDAKHIDKILDSLERSDAVLQETRKLKEDMDIVLSMEKEVDAQITAMQLKLMAHNRQLKNNARPATPKTVERRVEVVEHKYGLQLAENQSLLRDINHLEGEKAKLDKIYTQLEQQLTDISKELNDHIEKAKVTYSERDSKKRNMNKMTDHLEKSTASYESEMQNLQFRIDVLKRLELFMTKKNKFRPDMGTDRKRRKLAEMSLNEKDVLMYTEELLEIHENLEESDLHAIIRTFIELEEENYALFKNITETRNACHHMQAEIDQIKHKIQSLCRSNRKKESMANRVELIEKVETSRREADKKEENINQADLVIHTYLAGVLAILRNLGYKPEDIRRLAGAFKHAEERNVRVYLAELERYVNMVSNLKTTSEYLQWMEAQKLAMCRLPVEPLPPRLTLLQRLMVVPPQYDENDDADDPSLPAEATFRPLNCDEILHHVDGDLLESQMFDQSNVPLPAPYMTDPISEATGNSSHFPVSRNIKASASVDMY